MAEKLLVAPPILPLLAAPDLLSEQVSQALVGAAVEVLATDGGYRRVRTWDGYEGWVEAVGLTPPPEDWGGRFLEIEDLWVNLRPRPDSQAAGLAHAFIGCRFPRLGESGDFVELLHPDGRRLWVEEQRTRAVGGEPIRPARPAAVTATARRFLGVPYLWGGTSPWGLDCSGFVQLVLKLHGIPIRRDAGPQSRQGEPVVQGGTADLVFFGPQKEPERVTHVGMMLDDRRFIHARGSARVRVDFLHAERWTALFRGARRFVAR